MKQAPPVINARTRPPCRRPTFAAAENTEGGTCVREQSLRRRMRPVGKFPHVSRTVVFTASRAVILFNWARHDSCRHSHNSVIVCQD